MSLFHMMRWVLIFIVLACNSHSETITLLRNGIDDEYNLQALIIALDHTVETHGEYKISLSPIMNDERSSLQLAIGKYANPIRVGIPGMTDIDLDYIPFPVQLGILGYRVCYSNQELSSRIHKIQTIEDLQDFSFGASETWLDYNIYKANGLRVESLQKFLIVRDILNFYDATVKGEIDFFCRPVSEHLREKQRYRVSKPLMQNRQFAFFITKHVFLGTIDNDALVKRIYSGFVRAYEDGTFLEFWNKKYKKSIDSANLRNRKVFYLNGNALKKVSKEYKRFIYKPNTK